MAANRILILGDDPSEAEKLALELSRAGYVAPIADFRDLPHLMIPEPDLVIICFSPNLERALGLAQIPNELRGLPILVVSALSLSQLEDPLRILPIVSGVLFKPYSAEILLKAVREARNTPMVVPSPLSVQGGRSMVFRRPATAREPR